MGSNRPRRIPRFRDALKNGPRRTRFACHRVSTEERTPRGLTG
jgi:hypothetical protein